MNWWTIAKWFVLVVIALAIAAKIFGWWIIGMFNLAKLLVVLGVTSSLIYITFSDDE